MVGSTCYATTPAFVCHRPAELHRRGMGSRLRGQRSRCVHRHQAPVAAMLPNGGGAIVNTASATGLVGRKDRTAYCASKGAVIALTRQVAVQYAGTGIRCNSVSPGT